MRTLALLAILSCNIPTRDDLNMTVDECRQIVQDQIPVLVNNVISYLADSCGDLAREGRWNSENVSTTVLNAIGCSWDQQALHWVCPELMFCK